MHMIRRIVVHSLCLSSIVLAQYTPSPRWAQAVALLGDTLYVHGGLSDPFNSYSYSSAPEVSDLLVLDLSTSFSSSSPPWQLSSSNSSPALAWHTLSAFSSTGLFLFGGQPNPNSLTVLTTLNDSSGLLSITSKSGSSFLMEPQSWGNEPMRRIRHSASYTSGKVWLIGGEKADGSGNAFSDHYSFDPSGPEFFQLPSSSSAPPDIYGHASVVLPDGRLLVLGGYCGSCAYLVPMNTVWSLNTTQNPPVWEKLSVSNNSYPTPRRDFAALALSNGHVLIHGGGDAQLQSTYSDGWILDTGQNPMVWNSVEALEQLGQRKDHLAVQAGEYVLFCFGYGSSAPASASLLIYNPTTSSMVTLYTPPPPGSMPAITSLPAPSRTGSGPNDKGGPGTAPGVSSGTPSHSSGSSSSSNPTTAIALGTIFGVLGLVAGGLGMIYYRRRARHRDRKTAGRFFPLADNPEFSLSEGSVAGAAPEAAHLEDQIIERTGGVGITDILAYLGINKPPRVLQPRKDMFVDEDTRSFGWAGGSGAAQRRDSEETSVWSLRSMGVLVRGVISSEPSGSDVDQRAHEWDKLCEGGQEGSIRQGSHHNNYSSHPAHRKDGSFYPYTDPFEDSVLNNDSDLDMHPDIPEKDADDDHAVLRSNETYGLEWTALGHQDPGWPSSVRSRTLTPLKEVSHVSHSDLSNSLPSLQEPPHVPATHSHADNPTPSSPVSIGPAPHSPTTSGSTLSRSHSMSRPDNWWSRLTKPPLLDRRTSITTPKPLDFRDPTPVPPLVALEDTKNLTCTLACSDDIPAGIHGRSLSSAHSGRTANTDSAEHLGERYDVVQRLTSDGSSSRRAPSLGSAEITEQGMLAIDKLEISTPSGLPHVDPPRSTLFPTDSVISLDMEAPSDPLMRPKTNSISPKKGIVSSRVKAYERRLSQELESQQIPTPRNTRGREEVPSRTRPTIQYGVIPRPSLFIANPDLGHIP